MRADHGLVVVGGGVFGASILLALARRGHAGLLLERGSFGRESTGKSAAIVRMHYSNPQVVRMALRSREVFLGLGEEVYTPCGWLFLVEAAEEEHARANVAMQLAEGVDVEEVRLDDVGSVAPGVSLDGVAYAAFERLSGFADPVAATAALLDEARREGARAEEGSAVERVVVERDRVVGVVVAGERVACSTVVLAAGAWTGKLLLDLGLELPLEYTREQDVVYGFDGGGVPCAVSDQVDRIYLRPGGELGESTLLVGRGFPKDYEYVDPERYDTRVDAPFEADVRTRLAKRFPGLRGLRAVGGRAGLYSITPDWHPVLGRVDAVDGLLVATGGSGHSFKLGPAIGELVAADVVGDSVPFADIRDFAPDRFERGALLRSTYGGNRA